MPRSKYLATIITPMKLNNPYTNATSIYIARLEMSPIKAISASELIVIISKDTTRSLTDGPLMKR